MSRLALLFALLVATLAFFAVVSAQDDFDLDAFAEADDLPRNEEDLDLGEGDELVGGLVDNEDLANAQFLA